MTDPPATSWLKGTRNAQDTSALMQRTVAQYQILNRYHDQLAITFTPNTGNVGSGFIFQFGISGMWCDARAHGGPDGARAGRPARLG